MTYDDFLADLAEKSGESRAAVERVMLAARERLTGVVLTGDELRIPDVGTFGTAQRAERSGRDPRTGDPLTIPARRVPTFRAAQALRAAAETLGS
jgi:DNA-binding protein HU-beta